MTAAERPAAPRSARLRAFAGRWFIAYAILVMIPFPLDHLPVTDALVAWLSGPWQALVAWIGANVLGVEAIPRYRGSGDTAYHHVGHLCVVVLALVVAIVGAWRAGGAPPSAKLVDRARAYARVFVGGAMLIYGGYKILPLQFPEPGPDRLLIPLEDTSPMGILWTFMGAGPGYVRLAGIGEVVSGLLLFWRRTATLGALLAIFLLANIVALNFSYDVALKLGASQLLVLALFIAAVDGPRLVDVLWSQRPAPARVLDPFPLPGRWRLLARGAAIGLAIWLCAVPSLATMNDIDPPLRRFHGIYEVVAFERGGADRATPAQTWLRVGIHGAGTGAIQTADGHGERFALTLDVDAPALIWTTIGAPTSNRFELTEEGPDRLRLRGLVNGAPTVILLRRRRDAPPLFLSRGVHWLQEEAFNR